MKKQVDLAQDPALEPEELEEQQQGEQEEAHPDEDEEMDARRTYLIDRDFQYRFATTWIATSALYVLLIFTGFYWAIGQVEQTVESNQALEFLRNFSTYAGLFLIILSLLFGLYFILLSHRISGPAYRLRRSLERIAKGEVNFSVHLRETDYLSSVAERVNDVLHSLRERNDQLHEISKEIDRIRSELEDKPEEHEQALFLCDNIQEKVEDVRTSDQPPAEQENGSNNVKR